MSKSDVSEIKSLLWLILLFVLVFGSADIFPSVVAGTFSLYYMVRSLYEFKKGEQCVHTR